MINQRVRVNGKKTLSDFSKNTVNQRAIHLSLVPKLHLGTHLAG